MLQIVQYQKSGEILVEEMPAPTCPKGWLLVKTAYSLISAGTEKSSVENAQGSLLERARKQPEQAKLVYQTFKREGLIQTIKKVQSKLDSFKSLGYSASGIVIESGTDEFCVGDYVACGGAGYANHAELICVPKNLAVKLPQSVIQPGGNLEKVSLKEAAYTTVGAIAMQGFRQAEPALGDHVAVIGLGLIGQITVQLLKAAGCKVVGLDINEGLFQQALKSGCDRVFRSSFESKEMLKAFTRGIGFDSVIITAATSSNQPLELALEICRKRGKTVIVGAVGMNVPRPPFYTKEIELRIACSYGPGRYDPEYEEGGKDYPPAYVRWTENRNMQAFVDLLALGKLDMKSLTTHVFDIQEAKSAYDIVTSKENIHYLGILIKYPDREGINAKRILTPPAFWSQSVVNVGFVGAGQFAQSYLLPPLKQAGVSFTGVSTSKPVNAKTVARQYGFKFSTTDSSDLIKSEEVNLVFCATPHDSHAQYVIESLKEGKSVFVEKPLAISREEISNIEQAISESGHRVMVGFNRRFSAPFVKIKEFFTGRTDPITMIYRVNAGMLPQTHWVYSQGGRIIGEACHFIDCMAFLTDALPVKVYSEPAATSNKDLNAQDNLIITIKFSDGSTGSVHYFSSGDSSVPKEYFEAYCSRSTAIMNNFATLELARGGKTKKSTFDGRKGHREEVLETIDCFKKGFDFPISFDVIKSVSLAAIAAVESLETGMPVKL